MVTLVVVISHKTGDLGFQLSGQKIILRVHNIFHGTVVAFNFALRHGMLRRRAGMFNLPVLQKRA